MSTKIKTGVAAASTPVFEQPQVETDFLLEYGVELEPGFEYNIVDFTDFVRRFKPTLLLEYSRAGWEKVAENKMVPGMFLFRISNENFAKIRAEIKKKSLALSDNRVDRGSGSVIDSHVATGSRPAMSTDELLEAISGLELQQQVSQ